MKVQETDEPPFLVLGEALTPIRMRELIIELRLAAGREILVRHYVERPMSARPAGTALRRGLGSAFYVRVDHPTGRVFARCRLRGEPLIDVSKIQTGSYYMTVDQAAAALGMSPQWVRRRFLGRPELLRYRFGIRVCVRRDQVHALADTLMQPMGVWVDAEAIAPPAIRTLPDPPRFETRPLPKRGLSPT